MAPQQQAWLTAHAVGQAVEVGTYCGLSASVMTRVDHLTCVDSWLDYTGRRGKVIGEKNFQEFLHNAKAFRFPWKYLRLPSVEAALQFADRSLDFVFIDAAHDYESVAADIKAWMPKVRGLICGHDYHKGFPGVVQAVNELLGKPKREVFGIWSFVL